MANPTGINQYTKFGQSRTKAITNARNRNMANEMKRGGLGKASEHNLRVTIQKFGNIPKGKRLKSNLPRTTLERLASATKTQNVYRRAK